MLCAGGAVGAADVPLATTAVGAERSWLFLLDPGLDDVLLCCEPSTACSGRPSLELRRLDDGRGILVFSKSRRLTLASAAELEVGGVS